VVCSVNLTSTANTVQYITDNRRTIKSKVVLTESSKEVGLEVNTEKTKLMCLHQNPVQQQNIKIVNRCLENVTKLKYEYLRTIVINKI
jgi:hypothetical protein